METRHLDFALMSWSTTRNKLPNGKYRLAKLGALQMHNMANWPISHFHANCELRIANLSPRL